MESKTRGHDRTRIWCAVVYPESAPNDWRDILDDAHIEWAESPLHDLDVNAGTGEVKKPHWHIVLSFDGVKSYEQVLNLLAPLNCTIPQRCHSLRGAVRYFCHLDNPDKYQYPVSSIVAHGGFDLASALAPTSSQRYEYIADMQEWCVYNNCFEFCDLFQYAASEHRDDWFPLLCDNCAFVMAQFLRSLRHSSEKKIK